MSTNRIERTKKSTSRRSSYISNPRPRGIVREPRRTRAERMRAIAGHFANLADLFEEEASRWDSDDIYSEN